MKHIIVQSTDNPELYTRWNRESQTSHPSDLSPPSSINSYEDGESILNDKNQNIHHLNEQTLQAHQNH
jgi:hypothetical protein